MSTIKSGHVATVNVDEARARDLVTRLLDLLQWIEEQGFPEDDPELDEAIREREEPQVDAAGLEATRLGYRYIGYGRWVDQANCLVAFRDRRSRLVHYDRSSTAPGKQVPPSSNDREVTQCSLWPDEEGCE